MQASKVLSLTVQGCCGCVVLDLEKSCDAAPGFVVIEALEQVLEFSVVNLST